MARCQNEEFDLFKMTSIEVMTVKFSIECCMCENGVVSDTARGACDLAWKHEYHVVDENIYCDECYWNSK